MNDLTHGAKQAGDEHPEAKSAWLLEHPIWKELERHPEAAELFSVLRWIDSMNDSHARLGRAPRPRFEPVRIGQQPSLAFAPSEIASAHAENESGRACLSIFGFGLFGPNGPLPLHLTEYAHERLHRYADPTFSAFADIFHHRLALLFYRAWADCQPTVNLDRPDDDRFTQYVASLAGLGAPSLRDRDSVPDHAKFFHASALSRQVRNAEGLQKILAGFLQCPVEVMEFEPAWLPLDGNEQTRLSSFGGHNCLGRDTILGSRVLGSQHTIRIRVGPLDWQHYLQLLPGQTKRRQVLDWVKNYAGLEFSVRVQLVIKSSDIQFAQLSGGMQLGRNAWLGQKLPAEVAADYLREEIL